MTNIHERMQDFQPEIELAPEVIERILALASDADKPKVHRLLERGRPAEAKALIARS